MVDLQNKDKTIQVIWAKIMEEFGHSYFSIVNFWDGDRFAIGFKRLNKLVYISTWHYRQLPLQRIRCFVEFELVDEKTSEPILNIKQLENVTMIKMIDEIKIFIEKDL